MTLGPQLRIIVGALVMGVALFGAIAAFVGPLAPDDGLGGALRYAAVAMVVVGTIGASAVSRRLRERLASASPGEVDPDAEIQTHTILAMALAEAGALISLVGALLTGEPFFFGLVLPFFLIAATVFPTETRLDALRRLVRE